MSAIAFSCAFGAAMAAMFIRECLPDHHLAARAKEVVKLGMGLVATLAALVLGLLIATAKGGYDGQSNAVKELAAKVILLDSVLAKYGPEAKDARELLRDAVSAIAERLWPE